MAAYIDKVVEDPGYWLGKRNVLYGAGKFMAHEIAHPVGEMITPELVRQSGTLAAAGAKNIIGLTAVGLSAGVSAVMAQIDYMHTRKDLTEFYEDELKAKNADLDKLAKTNRTIGEEVSKAKKERTCGIIFSFLATMASLAAVWFLPPIASALFGVNLAPAASLFQHHTLEGLGSLALQMGVGIGVYNLVKIPVHWIGDKFFGLDKETTHEKIVDLGRERAAGKVISREQVLSIFAKAHPELDQMITAKYGLSFDKLVAVDKQKAAAQIAPLVPLDQLTADINAGKINVSELAFAVEGQISGVRSGHGHKKLHALGNAWTMVKDRFRSKPEFLGMTLLHEESHASSSYAEVASSGGNFVERLARKKSDKSMTHVQLVQREPNAPSTQTVQ